MSPVDNIRLDWQFPIFWARILNLMKMIIMLLRCIHMLTYSKGWSDQSLTSCQIMDITYSNIFRYLICVSDLVNAGTQISQMLLRKKSVMLFPPAAYYTMNATFRLIHKLTTKQKAMFLPQTFHTSVSNQNSTTFCRYRRCKSDQCSRPTSRLKGNPRCKSDYCPRPTTRLKGNPMASPRDNRAQRF